MTRKFILIQTSPAEPDGRLERTLALADAVRQHGWQPVLATAGYCPAEWVPESLPFLPLFGAGQAVEELFRIRGDVCQLAETTPDAVRRGDRSVADLIQSRFPDPSWSMATQLDLSGRTKGWLRSALPPVLFAGLRWLYRRRLPRLPHWVQEGLLPPFLSQAWRAAPPANSTAAVSTADQTQPVPVPYADVQRDLEQLLCLAGVAATDHVCWLTARGPDLLAVQSVVQRWGPERAARFHLLFELSIGAPSQPYYRPPSAQEWTTFQEQKTLRTCLELYHQAESTNRIQLYASPELAEEYEYIVGLSMTAAEWTPAGLVAAMRMGSAHGATTASRAA